MKHNPEEIIQIIKNTDFDDQGPDSFNDHRFHQFLTTIHTQPNIEACDPNESKLEIWLREHRNQAWYRTLQNSWSKVQSKAGEETLASLFYPFLQVMDHLAAQLEPAPAYRGSSGGASLAQKPRRRAIEAADLPTFSPLFCTAIEEKKSPFLLKGLIPNHTYRFQLRCLQLPEWQAQIEEKANDEGVLYFHLEEHMQTLSEMTQEQLEMVWLLEDIEPSHNNQQTWTSGLVWNSPKDKPTNHEEVRKILVQPEMREAADEEIQQLIEINLLVRWEQYTKAYEMTRKRLLSTPTADKNHSFPYHEALWQFIDVILQEMIRRLKTAESVFRSLKAEWDALNSLQDLRNKITEWD